MGAIVIGVGMAVAVIGVVCGVLGLNSSETTSGAAVLTSGSIVFVGGLLLVALGLVHRALVEVSNRLDGIIQFEEEEATHLHHELQEHAHAHPLGLDADGFDPFAAEPEPAVPAPSRPAKPARPAPAAELEPIPVPKPAPRPEPKPEARPAPKPEPKVEAKPEPQPELKPEPRLERAPDLAAEAEGPVEAVEAEERPAPAAGGLPSWFRRKREAEPVVEPEPQIEPEAPETALPFEPLPPPRSASEIVRETEREVPVRRDPPPFLRSSLPERAPAPERPAAPAERPFFPGLTPDKLEPRAEVRRAAPEPRAPEPRLAEPALREPVLHEPLVREPFPRADLGPDPGAPPAFLREADLLGDDEPAPEPEITVLKSGVIGGMAYKLYSDGSIEADLPDGTLRFASLQDLRDHVSGVAPREG
ncbi:hypothetical protein [Ancylobacter sp. SL191]|uniref:hypothetical protein n=1 Tax=Ancylobacter sp. SL191 TaxID=2995166 RepID=UPI00226FDF41|nr:hypothetical protein [Ancylobacter sp. SL191]WAC27307.1 hypothetical protein OU996_20300 [Ancylobacter sp. SL191]